jgi:hypothetical protein
MLLQTDQPIRLQYLHQIKLMYMGYNSRTYLFIVYFKELFLIFFFFDMAKQKNMCVYGHMSKKSRVGRSALIFYFI